MARNTIKRIITEDEYTFELRPAEGRAEYGVPGGVGAARQLSYARELKRNQRFDGDCYTVRRVSGGHPQNVFAVLEKWYDGEWSLRAVKRREGIQDTERWILDHALFCKRTRIGTFEAYADHVEKLTNRYTETQRGAERHG